MTLVELLVYLVIAGICGSAARGIAGGTGGGFIAWVLLGLLGALLGTSIVGITHLPAPWTINSATLPFPIVWSIIGGVILVAIATATTSSSLPTPVPAEAQPPSAPAEVPQELTDEQILQITHTANLGEIAQAKLAQSRTRDPRTQVKEHQAVVDVIDQKLLPSAKDADVKAVLAEVRPKIAMHLQHAQDLQNAMQK